MNNQCLSLNSGVSETNEVWKRSVKINLQIVTHNIVFIS